MNPAEEEEREPLNPRYVLWARAAGLDPYELVEQGRASRDTVRVLDREDPQQRVLPWTIVFMYWIDKRWRDWALELGYRDQRSAQLAGHTGFDEWLERWVRAHAPAKE